MAKEKMTERDWVEIHLSGSTWGWEELVSSGRCHLNELQEGDLKRLLEQYQDVKDRLDVLLDKLGYFAG